jgi:MFS family permease
MEDWRRHLADESAERLRTRQRYSEKPLADGRMARGWRLVDDSWSYLRRRPRLLVLPALSALALSIATLALFVPTLYLTRDLSMKLSYFIAGAVCAGPFIFISTFFNVGFLSMVMAEERGEQPRVRDGLRAARRRLGAIAAWTLLATIVGQILSGLQRLPGGDWAGQLLGALGGLAWNMATFFVVPVLALDQTGAREAVTRSAKTFRERWGETVTGDVTIGVVFGVLMIPGFIVGFVGTAFLDDHAYATGIVLLVVAVVLVAPLLVLNGAMTELFTLALYRYARGETATGPFGKAQLEAAIVPANPGRRWFRRG